MKSALVLLAVLSTSFALGQQPPVLQEPVNTDVVTCTGPPYARQGEPVISPSGLRVSAEVRSTKITPATSDGRSCSVTLLLHVVDPKGARHTLTVTNFLDLEWEFTFETYGFSRDGRLMLGRLQGTFGDAFEIKTVVFDAQLNKAFLMDTETMLKPMTPAKCCLYATPKGFTNEGRPILEIGATEEDSLPEGVKACYRRSLWEFDYLHQKVTRVAKGTRTQNFGRVDEGN